tara:strand:+ start:545 stop:1186 length:642 start_codon:yes stop_codon:yes gene_type:complete
MAVGAYFKNDFGALQIDGDDKTLVCIQSGTVATTQEQTLDVGTYYVATITINSPTAIMAVGRNTIWSTSRNASSTTFKILGRYNGDTVPYYIFDPISSSVSDFGLQMFNASGTLTFDALLPPMLILGAYTITTTGSIATLPTGRTVAWIPGARGLSIRRSSDEAEINCRIPSYNSGSGLLTIADEGIFNLRSAGGADTPAEDFMLTVLDVTGI